MIFWKLELKLRNQKKSATLIVSFNLLTEICKTDIPVAYSGERGLQQSHFFQKFRLPAITNFKQLAFQHCIISGSILKVEVVNFGSFIYFVIIPS